MGAQDVIYVVQTNTRIAQRCILMTTDPGDLVLDPTCGSGTTAYVAEQWGRRWITIDTSRVALALARARVMGARYPYYLLADSPEGQAKEAELSRKAPSDAPTQGDIRQGFVYERVPHITLKSIANNAEIDVIWEKHQQDLEPLRQKLNEAMHCNWEEWEIPRHAETPWSPAAQTLFANLRTELGKPSQESTDATGEESNHPDAEVRLPPTRYRLRFRVERGIRRGSTEVHVEHDRIVGVGNEASPGFSQVEANVTARLADYFAAKVAATVSMAGRAIAAESKAQIVKDAAGYPSLRLNVDFDRAWATVGQALQRAEIEVAEADRDAAVFRALFPTSGRGGWLKRLVPGGERGVNATVIIRLDADAERVRVNVTAADGEPLAVELAERVLLTLREYA